MTQEERTGDKIGECKPSISLLHSKKKLLLKSIMTVMVVARGGLKKDRFHLLRDLWEIMGVVVLLLRKENICGEQYVLPKREAAT